jgi:hypothetical protein
VHLLVHLAEEILVLADPACALVHVRTSDPARR